MYNLYVSQKRILDGPIQNGFWQKRIKSTKIAQTNPNENVNTFQYYYFHFTIIFIAWDFLNLTYHIEIYHGADLKRCTQNF